MKQTKTRFAWIFALLLAALALFAFAACAPEGGAAKVELNPTKVELYVNGKTETVRASLSPADNSAVYEWKIADESIATIKASQNLCRVTPVKEGTTTLTVTAGGATATCEVKVGPDQHVQLQAPSFTYDADTGKISIVDPNADGVGSYRLDFYSEGVEEPVGSVTVANNEVVDTSRVGKGTYTVRLVAVGASNLYLDSAPSASTATITVTKDARYDLGGTGDASALERADNWAYYKYDWVVVDTEQAYFYDGAVHFTFSNNAADSTEYQWITQLIYNWGQGEAGHLYKMVLDINTTTAGRATLGGKPVTLHEGNNRVTVGIDGNELFKIMFGVYGEINTIKEATVTVSIVGDIVETTTQPLKVPKSFTYDKDTNTIAIEDDENSEYDVNYTLGFFKTADAEGPEGTAIVTKGGEVDCSSVASGHYFLRLKAASAGNPYSDSDWTDVKGEIDVVNNRVPVPNGGQGDSAKNADKWYEWHPTANQNMGYTTTIEELYIDAEGSIHLTYSISGNPTDQPIKLHYNDSTIAVGDVYNFSCKITADSDGKITVNGEIFDLTKDVETEISVTRAQPDKNNGGGARTTITIQLGAKVGEDLLPMAGTFLISDIKLKKVDAVKLETPASFEYSEDTGKVTVTDTANKPDTVKGYELGFFKTAEAAEPVATVEIVEDGTFVKSAIASGTYHLRVRAIPASPVYLTSDWSEVNGTIEIVTERIDIKSGTLGDAAKNEGTWFYYKDHSTVEEVWIDKNNDIHLTFTVDADSTTTQPVKLLYDDPQFNTGDEYTFTCTLTSPVAGKITVNKQVIEIKEGDNEISVTRTQPDKNGGDGARATITIQFGGDKQHVEGTFVVKDIVLTPVSPAAASAVRTATPPAILPRREAL